MRSNNNTVIIVAATDISCSWSKKPRRSARPATARVSRRHDFPPRRPPLALTNRMTPNPEVIDEWMAAHGLQTKYHGIRADQEIILEYTGLVIPPELLKKHNPYFHRRGT